MMVDGWDGNKSEPGELPSADDVANSMYGGSKDIFEQAPLPDVENPSPPLPEGGLPEGWTMEQWNHYGSQWVEDNKED